MIAIKKQITPICTIVYLLAGIGPVAPSLSGLISTDLSNRSMAFLDVRVSKVHANSQSYPTTFSERLFALLECVARKWVETHFSAPIPLPKIDNNVVVPHTVNHGFAACTLSHNGTKRTSKLRSPICRYWDKSPTSSDPLRTYRFWNCCDAIGLLSSSRFSARLR
jgi:hypothetical protein